MEVPLHKVLRLIAMRLREQAEGLELVANALQELPANEGEKDNSHVQESNEGAGQS